MNEELEKIMAELKSADARHWLSLLAAAEKEIEEYRWHFSLTAPSGRVTASISFAQKNSYPTLNHASNV
jgi:hypothetical protein